MGKILIEIKKKLELKDTTIQIDNVCPNCKTGVLYLIYIRLMLRIYECPICKKQFEEK